VRRGREKQSVLETGCELANCPRDLRIDGVALAAGRGGVMGLIQDQQRAGAELTEPVAERVRVRLVDEQTLRNKEAGVRIPRVDTEAPFATDAGEVRLVENLECQAETVGHRVLPLQQHRGWAADHDISSLFAEQQLPGDQSGFDRFAEADVVGDEQVDARIAPYVVPAPPPFLLSYSFFISLHIGWHPPYPHSRISEIALPI
jgi:hypothetical protein